MTTRGAADEGESTHADIHTKEGMDFCLDAADYADVVIERFRPGVMHRQAYVNNAGQLQAAPAPRFSRTPGGIRAPGNGADLLAAWKKN